MARQRHMDEDALRLLREIEVHSASGHDATEACRKAGMSDASYHTWRTRLGGVGRSQLSEMRALEKESEPGER
ncbi:MAG: transposase [Pseudomonadota bacterium]